MSNIYLKAIRSKLSFSTVKGRISVQDLWDVPLKARDGYDLNEIAKEVNRALKASGEEDFVQEAGKRDPALVANQLRMEIVKDVIATKQAETAAQQNSAAKAAELQKLLGLRERKVEAALEDLTPEQIDAKIKELQAL